jgi:hypothetical protein
MTKGWLTDEPIDSDEEQEVHVRPVDDWLPHSRSRYCSCKPVVEEEPDYYDVVIHNAHDCRDLFGDVS